MQVLVQTWGGDKVMSVESALTPSSSYDGGVAERAQSDATLALECMGRLAALLVEKRVCSLQEAVDAMGVSGTVTEVA